jgi:tricarballylate dehydrogenase
MAIRPWLAFLIRVGGRRAGRLRGRDAPPFCRLLDAGHVSDASKRQILRQHAGGVTRAHGNKRRQSMKVDGPAHRLVVVGHGAAGLAAAVAAAESAQACGLDVAITLLEKADVAEAGGNTLWSPSYMRLNGPDRVAPDFEAAMREATGGRDAAYFHALARDATATVAWLEGHGVAFATPPYYLAAGPLRIQPVGGGRALVAALAAAAKRLGVTIRYRCRATGIVGAVRGGIAGVAVAEGVAAEGVAADGAGDAKTVAADAVVLACGGFQGDAEMMRAHFGPGGETMRLISPGTHFNAGDGIRIGIARGALTSGDWCGMHAEPIDPRSKNSAPVVLVYPYGIVVDRNGRRFFDEGRGLVHETWEVFARTIHFETPGGMAFAILDSRLTEISGFERAIRSEVAPFKADTLHELAALAGIDGAGLTATVAAFNSAATGDPAQFDAGRCDGLAASLEPPKSNWARAIEKPPFLAYPLIGAIAYTFGGLSTDARSRVLGREGALPGLFAAGEITGHFWGTAPNAVSVLRALVFGRTAGREAISYLESAKAER